VIIEVCIANSEYPTGFHVSHLKLVPLSLRLDRSYSLQRATSSLLERPYPIRHGLRVYPFSVCRFSGPYAFIHQFFPYSSSTITQFRDTINRINRETETIRLVLDRQPKRGINITFLSIACDVDVVLTFTHIRETVDEPRVRVEIEDDRLVVCEDGSELVVA
jgi:hypothetical protein